MSIKDKYPKTIADFYILAKKKYGIILAITASKLEGEELKLVNKAKKRKKDKYDDHEDDVNDSEEDSSDSEKLKNQYKKYIQDQPVTKIHPDLYAFDNNTHYILVMRFSQYPYITIQRHPTNFKSVKIICQRTIGENEKKDILRFLRGFDYLDYSLTNNLNRQLKDLVLEVDFKEEVEEIITNGMNITCEIQPIMSGIPDKDDATKHSHRKDFINNTNCSFCSILIKSGEERHVCSECNNVILCPQCFLLPESNSVHTDSAPLPHFSSLETRTDDEYFVSNKSDTTYQCFINAFKCFPKRRCLGIRSIIPKSNDNPLGFGEYEWISYQDVYNRSEIFGTALSKLVPRESMIGVMLNNTPEWFYIDFGCLFYGYTIVPINHFINSREFIGVINNCQPSVMIVTESSLVKLVDILNKYNGLNMIIYVGNNPDPHLRKQIPYNITFKIFSEILNQYKDCKIAPHNPLNNGVLSLVYSSGSTGTPKGIIIKDKDFLASLLDYKLGYPCIQLSFLSLSHLERRADLKMIYNGGRLGIYTLPKRDYFINDVACLRPTIMWAPPSIWNEFYTKYQQSMNSLRTLYPQFKTSEIEQIMFPEFRKLLGDRIDSLTTGGALISEEVISMMRRCWGADKVFNIYGSTEAMIVSVNDIMLNQIQYRIIPLQEIIKEGLATENPIPIGELVVKSDQNVVGYYRNKEDTEKSFKDGWFHMGDLVEEYEPRKIRILDRIKNSFKSSTGLFICLEKIENYYYKSPFIRHIFVYGDPYHSYLIAIIVPSEKALSSFDTNLKMDLNQNKSLLEAIESEIQLISEEKQIIVYETPKVIHLDNTIWTNENNLINGSGKFNRPALKQYYLDLIDKIYKEKQNQSIDLLQ
ncbi:hypothetical protein PPL_07998 [Heterostelium album PN500]|uniref:AMP-dependent synthetase/ligase domain-containing protein n=1 Tax=Heterostelium pallidum (strain ATCC 26659 / Pp 5 / PN500) TaxID=670386 RepID=D3BHJ5_HETP5|nr:hypothetical protein PPL_07998 [Heterostelium album PN500]EFA79172.1 hypothetical protein PPL_07998 [Heterostelium album PN500]|eukprot:XP_020431293.1 hypothetical protein PPL_07998 [Heterostelium album PN500]